MLCSRVQNLLSAYCDYQLTGAEMLEIREHLAGCHSCAREHASLRQVRQLLRALPTVEADRPFTSEVLEKQPRLKFDLPTWYYEAVERFRDTVLRFRRSACHVATGAALGLTVAAVSALPTPSSPNAPRAHVPVEISGEAAADGEPALPVFVMDPQPAFPAAPTVTPYHHGNPAFSSVTFRPDTYTAGPGWHRGSARPLLLEFNRYSIR